MADQARCQDAAQPPPAWGESKSTTLRLMTPLVRSSN